jgi:ribokinase
MSHVAQRSSEILVVGSINADLVVRGANLPRPGETVIGGQFMQVAGGKGANQAVAAARLSRSTVRFLGAVGDDALGRDLRATLGAEANLDVTHVQTLAGHATGVALIMVDAVGQNAISVASGANAAVLPEAIERLDTAMWRTARVLLVSLETPLDTVLAALRLARQHGLITVLNPAPAHDSIATRQWLELVDVLTPNESELAMLSGLRVDSLETVERAARRLQSLGARTVLTTLGARGALLLPAPRQPADRGEPITSAAEWIEPLSVRAIDATAAGDAFTGALAVALAEERPLSDAARWANRAAAISVTRAGAQPSLPWRHELDDSNAKGEPNPARASSVSRQSTNDANDAHDANDAPSKQVAPEAIVIREYRSGDLETLKRLTVDSFSGVTLEQNIEEALGVLGGRDWRWRKARHLDDDASANPAGIFVAEQAGRIVGYITTRVNRPTACGRVPNLAVAADCRNAGLGRRLIERALEYFRAEGLEYAVIETMARNAIGQHLYPACGFVEVARQVHFARRL